MLPSSGQDDEWPSHRFFWSVLHSVKKEYTHWSRIEAKKEKYSTTERPCFLHCGMLWVTEVDTSGRVMEGLKPPSANSLDELGFRAASHTLCPYL